MTKIAENTNDCQNSTLPIFQVFQINYLAVVTAYNKAYSGAYYVFSLMKI